MRNWFENREKKSRVSKRTLQLESLEDRMLLAVTAGAEGTAAVLTAAAEPTGNVIEITELTRAAINTAITNASAGDTIRFADSLSGQTFKPTTSVLTIGKSITVDGNGVIVSASSSFTRAAFVVQDGAEVTFQNFTFNSLGRCALQSDNGSISAVDCTFTNNRSSFNILTGATAVYVGGGGIGVHNGNISVERCTFDGNTAADGGAIGIYNDDAYTEEYGAGTVTITDSTFTNNKANGGGEAWGGAVSTKGANVVVSNSIFDHNSAVLASNSTKASLGGAIYAEGNVTIDSSVFTWNDACDYYYVASEKEYDWGFGAGGAIFTRANVTISNSLVVNNRCGSGVDYYAAAGAGGGIFAGSVSMYNCTVSMNTSRSCYGGNLVAGTGAVYNSIVAMAHVNNAGYESAYTDNTTLDAACFHNSYISEDNYTNNVGFTSVIADNEYRFASWGRENVQSFNWDFTLTSSSILRDTGDNAQALTTAGAAIEKDLDGNDRIINVVELGCYEIVPQETELPAPENLTAVGGADSIAVSWDAVDGAAGYTLRWQIDGSSDFEEEKLGADTTSWTITDLNGRRDYKVSVNALGDGTTTTDSVFSSVLASTETPETSYVVTSLADSGEGTLRDILAGLNNVEHAYITFADGLAGTVELQSAIELNEGVWASVDASGITFTAASGAEGSFSAFKMESNKYNGGFALSGAKVSGFQEFGFYFVGDLSLSITECTIEGTQVAVFIKSGVDLTIADSLIQDNTTSTYQGAGLYTENSRITVTDTVITRNAAYSQGGGVFFWYSTAVMENVTILNNELNPSGEKQGAGSGAGIYMSQTALTMTGCSIVENISNSNGAAGAGLYMDGAGELKMLNSLIAGNKVNRGNQSTDGNGGGLYVYSGNAVLSNTQIIGNISNGHAGAAVVLFGQLTLYNCTVAGNAALNGIGGILIGDSLGGTIGGIYNSVISGNVSQNHAYTDENICNLSDSAFTVVNWTLRGSELTAGSGSVVETGLSLASQVEKFTTPTYSAMTQTSYKAWDFTPTASASITDSGSNGNAVDPDGNDLTTDFRGAGYVRIFNDTVDVGAFEYQTGGQQLDAPVISTGKPGVYVSYGANRHQINWGAVANASGYELAYTTDGAVWKTLTVSETSAVVTGLTYEAEVTYKVRALGTGAYTDSEYSAAKTFTVCPMDINNDGDIAGADRTLLGNSWLAEEGDENYLPCCDIDGNEEVSGTDRSFLVKNWLCEVGEDELSYPRPLNADSLFEEFASEDFGTDAELF